MPLKNKNIRGCIICQNQEISAIVDPILFNAEMSHKDLKERLQNLHGWAIELTEIKAHARHIFYEPDDKPDKVKLALDHVIGKKTIDLVNEELAATIDDINIMRSEGKESTLEFSKLQKTKLELLNIKAKIEGDINDGTVIIPTWLERIDEENSNTTE